MPKIIPKENDTTDYSNLIVLCELTNSEYVRILYYTKLPKDNICYLEKIKTPRGYAVYADALTRVLNTETRGRKKRTRGYRIDLSTPSKINCLYRRIASMNKRNKDYCESGRLDIPKYVAEDDYLYINLLDYCKPQIIQLARKLECKPHKVKACLFDLLHSQYVKERKINKEIE